MRNQFFLFPNSISAVSVCPKNVFFRYDLSKIPKIDYYVIDELLRNHIRQKNLKLKKSKFILAITMSPFSRPVNSIWKHLK